MYTYLFVKRNKQIKLGRFRQKKYEKATVKSVSHVIHKRLPKVNRLITRDLQMHI